MRQKEAAEAERKASTRALEKLQKTVERYIEGEKAFALKLVRFSFETFSVYQSCIDGSRKRDHSS